MEKLFQVVEQEVDIALLLKCTVYVGITKEIEDYEEKTSLRRVGVFHLGFTSEKETGSSLHET